MRLARKLFILAAMTMAAMALTAGSASAVEVSNEANGVHCTAVTIDEHHAVSGGCRVEATSEVGQPTQVQAFNGMTFVTISTCADHFEAAIGEDGTGYLYQAVTSQSGTAPCTRTQCDESHLAEHHPHALIPWPLTVESTSSMEITFCLRDVNAEEGTAGTTCHTNVDITDDGDHQYEFRATGAPGSGSCENLGGGARVIGHWNVTPTVSHPAIEIAN
jgi:hypothetical protein